MLKIQLMAMIITKFLILPTTEKQITDYFLLTDYSKDSESRHKYFPRVRAGKTPESLLREKARSPPPQDPGNEIDRPWIEQNVLWDHNICFHSRHYEILRPLQTQRCKHTETTTDGFSPAASTGARLKKLCDNNAEGEERRTRRQVE